jgi:hypothetical protein
MRRCVWIGGSLRTYFGPVNSPPLVFDWGAYYPKPSLIIHFGPGPRRLFDVDFDAGKKSVSLLRPYQTSPTVGTLVVSDDGHDHGGEFSPIYVPRTSQHGPKNNATDA